MQFEAELGRCPSCGATAQATSFCTQCGAPLEKRVSLRKRGVSQAACPACGAARSPGQAFCTGCGVSLSSLPEAGGQPGFGGQGAGAPMPPPASPTGRLAWKRRLVGVAAAGLLLASAGIYVLVRHNNDKPAHASVSGTPSSSVSPTATSSPSAQSSDPSQPTFRCWDGTTADTLKACPVATQAVRSRTPLAGLNWVLVDRGPRLEDSGAVCRSIVLGERLLHRSCTLRMSGAPVCLNYSQWRTPAAASPDYDRLGAPHARARRDGSTQLVWGPTQVATGCKGLHYKAATMIDGQPWGVTAYSDVPSVTLSALSRFGQFRLTTEWRGVRQ